MEGIIYKYVSPSGKVYIGQTTNERHRRNVFNSNQSYGGVKIDNARKKYGPESFEYTVLIKVESDNTDELKSYLNELEVGFIRMYDSFNNGYNSTEGGESLMGYHPSEETRLKQRNSHFGKKWTDESRNKMSATRKGRNLTEEHRKKLSESRKGMKFSEEHKRKLSESMKGNTNRKSHK